MFQTSTNANGTARATTSATTLTAVSSAHVEKDISFTVALTAQVDLYHTVFIGVNVAGLLGSRSQGPILLRTVATLHVQ